MRVAIVWLAALAGAFPGYVEITDEKEFGRLYRNECDRCWVNATVSNARCCLERSGHEFLDVAHHCPRDVVPWGLRKSLRSYMRTGNVFASQTGRLYDALRGRSLVIVGDSIARQLAGFLERRHVEHLVDCGGEVCPRLRATVVQRDVAATLEARAAGEGGPVVVVFAGNALHERNATAYAAHVRETLRRLDAIAARYPNVAIFADATAQHFPTATGDFLGARTKVADAIPYYPCVPLTPGAPPNWRAEVARAQVAEHPRVGLARFSAITAPLYDAHATADGDARGNPISPDCTHFCYAPGLAEAIARELAGLVIAADRVRYWARYPPGPPGGNVTVRSRSWTNMSKNPGMKPLDPYF